MQKMLAQLWKDKETIEKLHSPACGKYACQVCMTLVELRDIIAKMEPLTQKEQL